MSIITLLVVLVCLVVCGYLRYDRNRWRNYALRAESDAWAWYTTAHETHDQIIAMQDYLYSLSLSQQTPTNGKDNDAQLELPLPIVAIRKDGSVDVGVASNGSNGKDNGKHNGKDKNPAESVESIIAEVESIVGKIDQRGKDKISIWHSGKGKNSPAEYAKRIKAMGALVH